MNATIDPELLKLVREDVSQLSTDVEKMKFENQNEMNNLGDDTRNGMKS